MQIIGILGGVASGKSTIARMLAELGSALLDADAAGHQVLHRPEIEAAIRARWGTEVFGPDGRIDRAQVARIVFAPPPEGPAERAFLEQLTHPEIARLLAAEAQRLAAAGAEVGVLDAPLLLEAGWDKLCQRLIFADAPQHVRRRRALGRGWSVEDFEAREAAQESLDRKRRSADVVIDTSGSLQQTRSQVERFWQSLLG